MKKGKVVSLVVLILFMICMLFFAGSKEPGNIEAYEKTDIVMGTNFQGTVYGGAENILPDLVKELKALETETLSAKEEGSEIGKLNVLNDQDGNQDKSGITISRELAGYLKATLDIAKKSNGALDPTVGIISGLWDFGGAKERLPKQEEIDNSLKKVGYENIFIEDNTVFMPEGTSIDLGAVGKGIGADFAADYIKEKKEIEGAVIALGGSVALIGNKPDGENWKLAIVNPRAENKDNEEMLGVLSLKGDCFVSTSGDYEKYFMQDDKRYHHILNPKTGYPAESGLISVTVVCDSGLNSDGLSTACFVLGLTEGMELLETYNAQGIFVDEEKNVYVTKGLASAFTLTAEDYQLAEGN